MEKQQEGSSSSESDFWEMYEVIQTQGSNYLLSRQRTFSDDIGGKMMYNQQSYYQLITRIRNAYEQEIIGIKIRIKNQLTREWRKKILALKGKYKQQIGSHVKANNGLVSHIILNKREINRLKDMVKQQEVLISQIGIEQRQNSQNSLPCSCQLNYAPLQQEIDALTLYNQQLKETCKIYHTQILTLQQSQKSETNDKVDMERHYEKVIAKIKQEAIYRENDLLDKIESLTEQLVNLKAIYDKEMQVRDILKSKHESTIESLQNELAQAKQVIFDPRLRNQIHERLKDYKLSNTLTNTNITSPNLQRKAKSSCKRRNISEFTETFRNSRDFEGLRVGPSTPKYISQEHKIRFISHKKNRFKLTPSSSFGNQQNNTIFSQNLQ